MEDRETIFICAACGRQGPARDFPDPPEFPVLTRFERMRQRVAERLVRIAEWIAP